MTTDTDVGSSTSLTYFRRAKAVTSIDLDTALTLDSVGDSQPGAGSVILSYPGEDGHATPGMRVVSIDEAGNGERPEISTIRGPLWLPHLDSNQEPAG